MLLSLTDLSSETLQSQIVRQVRARILAGELTAGSDLPSIRELARAQRVSVITVQRAYETLLREGLIHARRGKGFFVSELPDGQKRSLARQRLCESLRPIVSAAAAEGLSRAEILDSIDLVLKQNGHQGGEGR
jgi:DNA-binding transcriptional regulator YhcF (GntR family)